MLLTLTTTHAPATDLGYLLHKNPARPQSFELPFGTAHVLYPEATDERCTAALYVDVDPVGLVRGRKGSSDGPLTQYVNDRPYVASSFLSVAISRVLRTALSGRCKDRPELAASAIPLTAELPVVPCRGGESLLRRLFEPLGWEVGATHHGSRHWAVTLSGTARLADLLSHLYVLIPVLDDDKHYFVGGAEVEKLLARGEGWLEGHPERELIADRYLSHRRSLTRQALSRLADDETIADPEEGAATEVAVEKPIRLNTRRMQRVAEVLAESGARAVLDLGCGQGRLMQELIKNRAFERIVGVDVSFDCLEITHRRLKLDRLPEHQRGRVELLHGSATYRDKRLEGFDAIAVIEVIEHLDLHRLESFERVLFEHAAPGTVIVSTPNREYNVRFEGMAEGALRHRDHRFEWTRAEFEAWASGVAERHGYTVRFEPIGDLDEEVGAPTQMGVFRR